MKSSGKVNVSHGAECDYCHAAVAVISVDSLDLAIGCRYRSACWFESSPGSHICKLYGINCLQVEFQSGPCKWLIC